MERIDKVIASLLDILQTTPSPIARVDHATGNSFINNIEANDDDETIMEKVRVWYRDMVNIIMCYMKMANWNIRILNSTKPILC